MLHINEASKQQYKDLTNRILNTHKPLISN